MGTENQPSQLMAKRIQKLEDIKKEGINPYPYRFDQKNHTKDILKENKKLKKESKTKKIVSVAGRIMTLRSMGKASFGHIQDQSGKIQFYIREDSIGKKQYALFKKLDIGDIIGLKGNVFRTKLGEISINVKKLELLCKSLRPLPEKWHGLKEIEARYRKRYLDLISNPRIKEIFTLRSAVISKMRQFLNQKEFMEVETPTLQEIYGGAAARPFMTHHHELKTDLYLRISPELYLKRLMVGGFEKIYEICKNFRNESITSMHNPEFTMIELYQAYADYNEIMDLTEQLIKFILKETLGTLKINYQGQKLDFGKKWPRITMKAAIKKYAKIDVDKVQLKPLIKKHNLELPENSEDGLIINGLFEKLVEEKLIQPTFIVDYPIEVCTLMKVHRKDKRFTERFELFIAGFEVANAYSELNDPIDQKDRLLKQAELKKLGEIKAEETHPMDKKFIEALEYGMPPTGGLGIGIDRLIMIFTDSPSIKEVILFPQMKPLK